MATYSSTDEAVGSEQANRDAMFKKVFEDRIANLTPDGKKLLQRIKFVKKDKQLGGSYSQPVVLGMELGITHAGSDEGAFALELPVPGNIKEDISSPFHRQNAPKLRLVYRERRHFLF